MKFMVAQMERAALEARPPAERRERTRPYSPRLPLETIDSALTLHREGYTWREIGVRLGASSSGLRQAVIRLYGRDVLKP